MQLMATTKRRISVADGGHSGLADCNVCLRENMPMRKQGGRECVDCDAYWTYDLRATPKTEKKNTKQKRLEAIRRTPESQQQWYDGEYQKFLNLRAQNNGRLPRLVKSTVVSFKQVSLVGQEADSTFIPEALFKAEFVAEPEAGVIKDVKFAKNKHKKYK